VSSIAPIDAAQLPADVRKAGPEAQKLYATALAFEQVLVSQLTEQLQSTAGALTGGDGDGSGDDSQDSTSSLELGMVPGAFAQGLTSAGGMGIARQLYDSLKARGA
jgi:Rod binding domain-containing protein